MLLFDATAFGKKDVTCLPRRGCPSIGSAFTANFMASYAPGTIAVIFVAQRSVDDNDGYLAAAEEMVALAVTQPGYLGIDSVRGGDGLGITVSYWESEIAAKNWRDHPRHAVIRDQGRGVWYTRYDLHISAVTRSYDWTKP